MVIRYKNFLLKGIRKHESDIVLALIDTMTEGLDFRDVEVAVEFKTSKHVHIEAKNDLNMGAFMWDGDFCYIEVFRASRSFTVYLGFFVHEMMHLRQYIKYKRIDNKIIKRDISRKSSDYMVAITKAGYYLKKNEIEAHNCEYMFHQLILPGKKHPEDLVRMYKTSYGIDLTEKFTKDIPDLKLDPMIIQRIRIMENKKRRP